MYFEHLICASLDAYFTAWEQSVQIEILNQIVVAAKSRPFKFQIIQKLQVLCLTKKSINIITRRINTRARSPWLVRNEGAANKTISDCGQMGLTAILQAEIILVFALACLTSFSRIYKICQTNFRID